MKKEEFIAALAAELRDLSKEDIARSLEYYGEMIDERVEDGMSVEDAVDALGGVEAVTKEIMAELPRERRAADVTRHGMDKVFDAADSGIDAFDKGMDALDERMNALGRKMGALGERIGKKMEARYAQYEDGFGEEGDIDDVGADFGEEGDIDDVGADFDEEDDIDDVGADFDEEDENERWYRITEPFTAVDVQAGNSDVRILRSNDGETRIETESYDDSTEETVTVQDGVLMVIHSSGTREARKKKGTLFGLNFKAFVGGGGSITLYLPDEMWERLSVKTLSGEIEVEDLRARAALLSTKSGDVEARHLTVEGRLEMESMSGDIDMDDVTSGELSAHSMSGDVDADGINVGAAELSSKSGDIDMESVVAQGTLRAESTSGDVSLHRCDGRDVLLRSTSGDIDGTLLTPKAEFRGRSVSGDVNLPKNAQEGVGVCEASTTSGDVSLRIAP